MRAAVGLVRQQIEQLPVVARILACAIDGGARRRRAGKARRMHAGRAVQRIDANSRIVGERRQS
jgi:hypothetical protein